MSIQQNDSHSGFEYQFGFNPEKYANETNILAGMRLKKLISRNALLHARAQYPTATLVAAANPKHGKCKVPSQ
jgi:hypothetical protein